MIHGSSSLNVQLQVAELILVRMSHLREGRSLQLREKAPLSLQKEVFYNVATSLSDASQEVSLSADLG